MRNKNTVVFVSAWDPIYDFNKKNELFLESINPGLVLLATILNKRNYEAYVLDVNYTIGQSKLGFFTLFDQQVAMVANELTQLPYNSIVGFTSLAVGFHFTIAVIRKIKELRNDLKIFLGGPHASMNPEKILVFEESIDAIMVGESEEAIVPFCDALAGWSEEKSAIPFEIPNIWYRSTEGIRSTVIRRQVVTFSELPVPDYDCILPKNRPQQRLYYVEGGRGCPYKCTYCATSVFWRERYCEPDLNRTVLEIERLISVQEPKPFIQISNDLFLSSKSRTTKIYQAFKNVKYNFEWGCYARIDTLCVDKLNDLERVGLKMLYFGIESGSENVQKKIHKNLDIEAVVRKLKQIKESTDVKVHLCFMYGFYFETFDDYLDTLRLLTLCAIEGLGSVTLAELRLMPGTKIYDERKEKMVVAKKFVGFNGEKLDYSLSEEIVESLRAADKEIYPLLYQDAFIQDNRMYDYVRLYCSFVSYIKTCPVQRNFYENADEFRSVYFNFVECVRVILKTRNKVVNSDFASIVRAVLKV